ncbi:MAG TPA: radical SAM protein [Actinobacteria bacterium]|nr:radical SAM protein [Actinomycetota bacterium]
MPDITVAFLGKCAERDEAHVPLGPLYIVAAIEKAGFSVDFKDYQLVHELNPFNVETATEFLAESTEILAVGCMANMLPLAVKALERVKAKNPNKIVILGGPGATGVGKGLITHFPHIDYVIEGEGEVAAVSLVKVLISGRGGFEDIDALVFRKNGKVQVNPRRSFINNLDELPFPAYYKLDPSQYDRVHLITTRGCPFSCTFCDIAPMWGRRVRKRSLSNVVKELDLLRELFGEREIGIEDDTFVFDRKRVLKFCHLLKKSEHRFLWSVWARIDMVDLDLMQTMANSGCFQVKFGIESGADNVLKQISKGYEASDILPNLRLANEIFEQTICFFMWGFPFESFHDFLQTLFLLYRIKSEFQKRLYDGSFEYLWFQVGAFPNSELYRSFEKDKLLFDPDMVSLIFTYSEELHKMTLLRMATAKQQKEFENLVQNHPDVFSAFYHYPTPDIVKKRRLIDNFIYRRGTKEIAIDNDTVKVES